MDVLPVLWEHKSLYTATLWGLAFFNFGLKLGVKFKVRLGKSPENARKLRQCLLDGGKHNSVHV